MTAVVLEIKDVAELDDKLPGLVTPDNPVKWAAYQALQNAAGNPVQIIVSNGDPLLWRAAREP